MTELPIFNNYQSLKAAFVEFPDDAEIWKVSDGTFTIKPRNLELQPSRELIPQYVATVGELRFRRSRQTTGAAVLH